MNTATPEQGRPDGALYRTAWRWHFYAGLLCLPVLVLMAVTGGLYLFNKEIEGLVYRDLLQVPAAQVATLPPQTLLNAAQAARLGVARAYDTPVDAGSSVRVGLVSLQGNAVAVFLDPYRGTVLGVVEDDWRLMQVVTRLHSLELLGPWANLQYGS